MVPGLTSIRRPKEAIETGNENGPRPFSALHDPYMSKVRLLQGVGLFVPRQAVGAFRPCVASVAGTKHPIAPSRSKMHGLV